MATALQTAEKFLAYDGDCPMCLATVGLLLKLGLLDAGQARPNHELEGSELEAARAAGIRNQLVAIDPRTGETRAGSDALLWLAADRPRFAWAARLLGLPGLRQLLSFAYQAVSYNRRVISPPQHQIACDCEPQVTVARRLQLIVPLAVVSMLVVAAYGAATFVGANLGTATAGAALMEIATAAGWLIAATAGAVLLRGMARIDYAGHLAVTMFVGALILLPAAAINWFLPRPAAIAVAVLALMFCFSTMFKMQVHRTAAQRLRWAWLWGWTAAMLGCFGAALAFYFRDALL